MIAREARSLRSRSVLALLVPAAAAGLLAGCASKPPPKLETITVPLPQNVEAEPPPPPAPPPEPVPPELVTASRGEDLWHLRSALNVAALICDAKVHGGLIPSYNRLLVNHKALLTAAVQTELDQFKLVDKRKWQALYDTHMTRLYNQYSLTQKRDAFCSKASETAGSAADLPAEMLSAQATAMIFRLNLAGDIQGMPAAMPTAASLTLPAPASTPAAAPAGAAPAPTPAAPAAGL